MGSRIGPQGLEHLPLLPYEWQLIGALGCTKEEYQQYKAEFYKRAKERGEAYAQVPDVQNGTVAAIVINLVIGIALTAVSVLLTPKPKAPKQQKQRQSINLGDDVGATRFNKSTQFDSVQDIARIGDVIPIMFGRYDEVLKTGGLSMSPPLLWSRMYSYGTHQAFKGLYTLGEGLTNDEPAPNREGIRFGTTAADGVPAEMLTLFWKPEGGRIKQGDLYFGSRGSKYSPDPGNNDDVYLAPCEGDSEEPALSHVYTPSSDAQFGCHSTIRNGAPYKLNWRIINKPEITGDDDPEDRLDSERVKISGMTSQGGTGREYSCYMGVTKYKRRNGGTTSSDGTRTRVISDVAAGDEIEFEIKSTYMTDNDANVQNPDIGFNDVNGSTESIRAIADDSLAIGEQFMIGRTLWQVIDRNGFYEKDESSATIRLRCTESLTIPGVSNIGLVSRATIDRHYYGPEDKVNYVESKGYCDPDFYPLSKFALGVIRTTRPCDSVEFGIRSQVWVQANGITDLADVPTRAQQSDYDEEAVQVTEGRVSRYLKRTSAFTVWLRPVDGLQEDVGWQPINEQFLITGESPVDVYNYLRISTQRLGGQARQFEYRFIPKNSADLRLAEPGTAMIQMTYKDGSEIRKTFNTVYGPFTVVTTGKEVGFTEDFLYHEQFYEEATEPEYGIVTKPTRVDFLEWLSDPYAFMGKSAAFTYEMFGNPAGSQTQWKKNTFRLNANGGNITVEVEAQSRRIGGPDAQPYIDLFGTDWRWEGLLFTMKSYSGNPDDGEENAWFTCGRTNFFAQRSGISRVGVRMRVTSETRYDVIREGEPFRDWAKKSQIQEVQFYDELSTSCDSGPEHTISYVTETVQNAVPADYKGIAMFGAVVRSSSSLQRIDQLRIWMPDGVSVRRWLYAGENYGPSNLFSDFAYYLLDNGITGLGRLANYDWIDEESFRRTAKYLDANNLRFDTVLTELQNLRSYLTEVAPLNLCNFTIKNGAFAIEPALPYDSSGRITTDPVAPKAIFTSGNVVDGSFTVSYLEYSERQDFRAVLVWTEIDKNNLPEKRSLMLRWENEFQSNPGAAFPQEEYDLSSFCTSKAQAKMIGQFLMSIRRRIDHNIQFQTSPMGVNLAPGDYIKVARVDAPSSYALPLGVIGSDNGTILCSHELSDGEHEVDIYVAGAAEPTRIAIEVQSNRVADEALWGSVFSAFNPRPTSAIYQIEQITMTEDGMAEITAVHFPTDESGSSLVAQDTLSTTAFREQY